MEVTMQALVEVLQKNLLGNQDALWQKEVKPKAPADDEHDTEQDGEVVKGEDKLKLPGLGDTTEPAEPKELPPVIREGWIE